MADLPSDLDRYRRAIIDREATLLRQLLVLYHRARSASWSLLRRLVTEIADTLATGATVARDWLTHRPLYHVAIGAVTEAFAQFGHAAAALIGKAQETALLAGARDAAAMIGSTTRAVVNHMLGRSVTGMPLDALFTPFGSTTARTITEELTHGLASQATAARLLQRVDVALGKTAVRAMTIARSETMAAYRTATLETFRQSGGRVVGWTWYAAGLRPCSYCQSMNGTEHPLSESLDSHANCRCVPIGIRARET